MSNVTRKERAVFGACILFLLVCLVVAIIGCNQTPPLKAVKVAPAENRIAPKEFVEQWQEFKALRDEVAAIQKKENLTAKVDQLNGMATRLQGQVPQGYTWEEETLSFKPQIPALPLAVPTPTPAAPAKK
jgi:hypothetical protein